MRITRRRLLITIAIIAGVITASCIPIIWDGLHDELVKCDVGVVLGNKVERSGVPSPALQARLDKAHQLYRDGWFHDVLVSGGLGKEGHDEALVMKNYLVAHGVPPERIIVDSEGNTSLATARNTARLARQHDWTTAFIISQYFHISRTRLALTRCGVSAPGGAHADYWSWWDFYSVPREAVGYVSYWFKAKP